MKILVYSSSSMLNPHNGVMLEAIENYLQEGHEVIFLTCGKCLTRCFTNQTGSNIICLSCKLQHSFLTNKLSKKVHEYTLQSLVSKTKHSFDYNSIEDIRKLQYKNVDIGYAALSSYISATRNLDPILSSRFRAMMDEFLQSTVNLTDAIEVAINKFQPDLICLFNGRFFETRPFVRIANQQRIETLVYEVVGIPGEYKTVTFKNVLPHDISYNTSWINQFWDISPLLEKEKLSIGCSFFSRKREGQAVIDKSYTLNQELGKLPEEWDKSIRNIVIFNSSEDEFAAIGAEYQGGLFSSQIEGIRYILSTNEGNCNLRFYLRIHPNLAKIKYKYHLDLLSLSEYKNCVVIDSSSDISTYTLIDNADKIIVFGSTVGLEASYWEKPVLLLGSSFYQNLDVVYCPEKKEDISILLNKDLLPKSKMGAIKYGFYALGERGTYYKYFDYNPSSFKNLFNYQTLLGSVRLYYLIFVLPVSLSIRFANIFKKNQIPVDER